MCSSFVAQKMNILSFADFKLRWLFFMHFRKRKKMYTSLILFFLNWLKIFNNFALGTSSFEVFFLRVNASIMSVLKHVVYLALLALYHCIVIKAYHFRDCYGKVNDNPLWIRKCWYVHWHSNLVQMAFCYNSPTLCHFWDHHCTLMFNHLR